MAHQPYRDWIVKSDELSPSDRGRLDEHLQTCPACRQFERAWHQAHSMLTSTDPMAAPAGLSQQVVAGVQAARRRRQQRGAWLIFGLTLVGSLLLVPGLLLGQVQMLAGGMTALLRQLLQLWDGLADTMAVALQLLEVVPGPPLQVRLLALVVSAAGLWLAMTTTLGGIWTAALARLTIRIPSAGGGR